MSSLRRSRRGQWRSALITGGSRGIGRTFADELARRGVEVTLIARDPKVLERAAGELRAEHGAVVRTVVADLAEGEHLEHVAALIAAEDHDLLVNNVGGGTIGPFADTAWPDISRELRTNLDTTLRLMHAAIPMMLDRGRGTVINVAAGNAFYPTPYAAVYAAAKAAIVNLSEAVAQELRGTGVRVSVICPGFTPTDAQGRAGIDPSRIPKALWTPPEKVATVALGAAVRRRTVVSASLADAVGNILGRHTPHRLLLPLIAHVQQRIHPANPQEVTRPRVTQTREQLTEHSDQTARL